MNQSTAQQKQPETRSDQRRTVAVVAGVTLIQIMATMGVMLTPVVAPELARTLSLDPALIGLQISLAYVGAMTMSTVAGAFIRRFGGIRTNQTAALLVAAGCALIATAELWGLAAGTMVLGAGYGLTNPAASHLMMRVATARNRNLIFSIKQTGQPLGGVVAGLMAPPIAVAVGWQASLLSGTCLALCSILLVQPLRAVFDADRDASARLRQRPFDDLMLVARHRDLALLAGATLCFSGVQLSLMGFAVTMLVEELGVKLVAAGAALAAIQIAGVTGRLLWGAAADRLGDGNLTLIVIAIIAALAGLATSCLDVDTPLLPVYGVLLVFGFTAVGWNGVFMAEIARLAPAGRVGGATGAVLTVTFLGVILAPMAFTGLHALTGAYTTVFGIMATVSLVGSLLILAQRRFERCVTAKS